MKRLLIFLKYPTPGKVKTRLAKAIGAKAAAEVYRACTELTLKRLQKMKDASILYIDPPDALLRAQDWLGLAWSLRPQQGTTLGERMTQAMEDTFAQGAQRVVIIGTDSPWLTEQHLADAFVALAESDLVIGPAQDGGYYLLGLRRAIPQLFEDIPWSTPEVCARTLTKARELKLSVTLLPTGYDVDELDDLYRLIAEQAASEHLAALANTPTVIEGGVA